MKVMITGANGHLGRKLAKRLTATGEHEVVAVVRSARAAKQVKAGGFPCKTAVVDYADSAALKEAGAGCALVVHLAGIIKETKANSFHKAHEETCQALVDAGLDAERLVCLGVLGSDLGSSNACFSSRARAERILAEGTVPAIVLRVPMVLGQGDHASRALAAKGRASLAFTFRAASLEQPIAADDVIEAIISAGTRLPATSTVLELAGPESLSRRALIKQAGRVVGGRPLVVSLPLGLGMAMAGMMEALLPWPPVTRAMLGVLDHDDAIDPTPATQRLGIALTPLDVMLRALRRR